MAALVSVIASTTNVVTDVTTPYVISTATEPTEITSPPAEAQVLKWAGAITPQKWMNFYTTDGCSNNP